MEDMKTIMDWIFNNGMGACITAYFIFRDYKFNSKLIMLLDRLNKLVGGNEEEEE